MFKKILIANRGEIAVRVLRTCKEMGIKTVAVHSQADAEAMHVRLADESVCIGPALAKDSYLNMPAIISAALVTHADAIHPGVGFLSENPVFAQMVQDHNLVFIGPTVEHVRIMGDKITAKHTAAKYNIPLVQGSMGTVADVGAIQELVRKIGYPILIKAANGGGGKGMKVVTADRDLENQFRLAKTEAMANFGDDQVYVEQYLDSPRHIEVQVLGDHYGKVIHLGERDCSLQRRHQKIWEEAPSPALTPAEREYIGNVAVRAMEQMGYRGLGTVEFLYENGKFYFIEMNTRIQVEHTITEMITGINLVAEQIKVAAGEPLSLSQGDVTINGHSIECRINAENSYSFIPSPGKVSNYHTPGGYGVRVDSHLYSGYIMPPYYDSLVAKLIVHADNRELCIERLKQAGREFVINGIDTLLPLHLELAEHPAVVSGNYNIKTLEQILADRVVPLKVAVG